MKKEPSEGLKLDLLFTQLTVCSFDSLGFVIDKFDQGDDKIMMAYPSTTTDQIWRRTIEDKSIDMIMQKGYSGNASIHKRSENIF